MAATLMARRFVRAAIAAARVTGDDMYPSSTPWCSEIATTSKPFASAHSHMSRQAAYCRSCVVRAKGGTRRSNRRPTMADMAAVSIGAAPGASMRVCNPGGFVPRRLVGHPRIC